MVNLSSISGRFEIPLQIVEGGSGIIRGVLAEAEQNSQPSFIFSAPRLVLRVRKAGLLKPGVAVQTPEGLVYFVGYNGPSETHAGHLWDSYRLFKTTGRSVWTRRSEIIDLVTGLPRNDGVDNLGTVWSVIEQIDREALDRKVNSSFEQARYICSARVLADDYLDGKQVIRSDIQLGLTMGVLT